MSRRGRIGALGRLAGGFPRWLATPVRFEDSRRRVMEGVEQREESFLGVLERGVFAAPNSPYGRLIAHAGLEPEGVRSLVREGGLEGALEHLREAGVGLTLEEFRGLRPIVRPGLELAVRPSDFDNPLVRPLHLGGTGGSRGKARRVLFDLDHRGAQADQHALFLESFGLRGRPSAVWRPVPPGMAGVAGVLAGAKVGQPLERWFSQTPLTPRHGRADDYALTLLLLGLSRLAGRPLPTPEHVPVAQAVRVARWLEGHVRAGRPAFLVTTASSGVRICHAARDHGLDLAGSFFRLGGEPLTPAKARAIRAAGVEIAGNYSMTEIGRIGVACATPATVDDYHVALNKLAVIAGEGSPGTVRPLLFTTLSPSTPKLLINVDAGDDGLLEQRGCGCLLGELGLTLHVSRVSGREKFASDGVHFLGAELLELVDDVLPNRFGGGPTDYQLVETEVDALPAIQVIVSPRVGEVDPVAVIETVLDTLRNGAGHRGPMADVWRDADSVRVVRREPYETAQAKILPLHLVEPELALDADVRP
ncbi:MAG: hypothetical protein M3540_09475 [Actinomycetota bacterium]|nr:hypothetical protein [Actinomycetota bacterium]